MKRLVGLWNEYNGLYTNMGGIDDKPSYEMQTMYLIVIWDEIIWFVKNNCLNDLLNYIVSLKEDECVRVSDFIKLINKCADSFMKDWSK